MKTFEEELKELKEKQSEFLLNFTKRLDDFSEELFHKNSDDNLSKSLLESSIECSKKLKIMNSEIEEELKKKL